jgi:hypothetical protein
MFQGKLELERERCEELKLELQREKQKGKEMEIAVEKEKQLGQQKVEIEKEIIQELKREFLTLEGQRDSLSAQVMKIASARLYITFFVEIFSVSVKVSFMSHTEKNTSQESHVFLGSIERDYITYFSVSFVFLFVALRLTCVEARLVF